MKMIVAIVLFCAVASTQAFSWKSCGNIINVVLFCFFVTIISLYKGIGIRDGRNHWLLLLVLYEKGKRGID